MKRRMFFVLVLISFISTLSFSQTITVTNPHGGENWVIGHTYTIKWNSNGISGTVGIKLFQNGSSLGYIAQNVPNTGSYNWTIGSIIGVGQISAGSHYQIQVKKSGVAAGLSTGEFTISNPSTALITVTNPHGGENWVIGNTYTITWNSNGISGTVGIKLFQNGSSLGYIAQNVPNTGSYNWTIGSIIGVGQISAGSHYQIQVKKSGVATGLSTGEFTISTPSTASITVMTPVKVNSKITKQNIKLIALPDLFPYGEQLGYIDWKHKIVEYGVAIKNKGRKDANNVPVKLEIYLRGNPGHIVKTINYTYPSIPKGKRVTFFRSYQLNNIGTYDFTFRVNPKATVKEYMYSNNSAKRMTISREKLPDLIVWLMTQRVDILSRSKIRIGVQNIGQKISSPTKLKVFIQTKGTKYIDIPAIAPGKFYTAERKEWFHSLKDVWVEMWIDPYNILREDNEENNYAKTKLKVWSHTIFDK